MPYFSAILNRLSLLRVRQSARVSFFRYQINRPKQRRSTFLLLSARPHPSASSCHHGTVDFRHHTQCDVIFLVRVAGQIAADSHWSSGVFAAFDLQIDASANILLFPFF